MSDIDEALVTETAQRIYQRLYRVGDYRSAPVPIDCVGIIEAEIRQALERQRKLREALEAHQPILNEAMDKLLDAGHEGFVGEDMMNRFYDNEALLAESLQNADDVMERGKRVLELWQDGWRLAPMEPTPEMLFESSLPDDLAAAEYKAMLAASPSPEESNGT